MKTFISSNHIHIQAAWGWIWMDDLDRAQRELLRVSPKGRKQREFLELRRIVLARHGDWQRCLRVDHALVRLDPDKEQYWLQLADTLHSCGKTRIAKKLLLRLVVRFDWDGPLTIRLARYCCQMGQVTEARVWLRRGFARLKSKPLLVEMLKSYLGKKRELAPVWDDLQDC